MKILLNELICSYLCIETLNNALKHNKQTNLIFKYMENLSNLKKIGKLIYKLSISDTLRGLGMNEEVMLTKNDALYSTANNTIRWLKSQDSSLNYTIRALDKFQDKYIVRRIPAK